MSGPFEETSGRRNARPIKEVPMSVVRPKTSPYESKSWEDTVERAEMMDRAIVVPQDTQLFVDIDDENGWNTFLENINFVISRFSGTYSVRPSPSGEPWHFHITVNFDTYQPLTLERIAMQAILGSDRTREALSFLEFVDHRPHPTIFFEKKA